MKLLDIPCFKITGKMFSYNQLSSIVDRKVFVSVCGIKSQDLCDALSRIKRNTNIYGSPERMVIKTLLNKHKIAIAVEHGYSSMQLHRMLGKMDSPKQQVTAKRQDTSILRMAWV